MKRLIYPNVIRCAICSPSNRKAIMAASSKEIMKDMVRVRSSNIWSYMIDVDEFGDDFGDVYVQFKGRTGGPDDVYVYYDVPVTLFRKWVSSSSKGHFFWKYIRNKFKYSKLTGDKKGKLVNAINH